MNEFTIGQIRPVECFKEGWELIKDEYWLLFAMTLVGLLIAGAVPLMILLGPMYCGIYYAMLRKMDTGKARFEDVFKGFEHFGASLVLTLVMAIPMIAGLILIYISMAAAIMGSVALSKSGDVFLPIAFAGVFVEAIAVALIITCLHAFITFGFPLIVDRNLGGIDAFKLSARAVWANLGSVVTLILLQFVLSLAGLLLCFVGIYLVLPVMFAGVTVAFRKLFPVEARVPHSF